jgi:hypothetical protein
MIEVRFEAIGDFTPYTGGVSFFIQLSSKFTQKG